MALPMVHPMHIMMANGQYTDPRMSEHDRCGNVRTKANHRFQRVDLMERADLTQI